MPTPVTVLVVEDDPTVAQVLRSYLTDAGYQVEHVADGVTALTVARSLRPDLVVLDLMLPGLSGLEVCARLLEERPDLPVMILTALGEEEERLTGLETGADDYLVKPFSPREVVLRAAALLRRAARAGTVERPDDGGPPTRRVASHGVELDLAARTATVDGAPVALTSREFDLLAHLMLRPGTVFGRERLLHDVWGWDFGDASTVTVHVRRLRRKVERDPAEPRRLVTVWGTGYRWDDR